MKLAASPEGALRAAVEGYLDWHALRGSSQRHVQEVRRILAAFSESVGQDTPVGQVGRDHCTAFLRAVQERRCKTSTLKAYHRAVDAFFHWLVAEERLEVSPMRKVPKPRPTEQQIKPLTAEELSALLARPDPKTFVGLRDSAFMGLLADTGLRLSEALAIRMADIDPQQHSIAIVGKGGHPRTVFYGESAALLLRRYLKRRSPRQPEDLLFVNSLGEPLLRFAMSERVHAYGDQAGIRGKRVSPHTLRHTFAVAWLMGGGDSLSLQRLLGHTTPAMTSRYVNFAAGDLGRLHRSVSPLDRLQGRIPVDRAPGPGGRPGEPRGAAEPRLLREPRKRIR